MGKTGLVVLAVALLLGCMGTAFAGTYDSWTLQVQGPNDNNRCSESVVGQPQFGEQVNLAFPAWEPYDTEKTWCAIEGDDGQLWSSREVSLDPGQKTTISGYIWAGTFCPSSTIRVSGIFYGHFHPGSHVSDFVVYRPDGTILTSVPFIGNEGYLSFTAPAVYSTLNGLDTYAYKWQATLNGATVPEPSAIMGIIVGVGCLVGKYRRRK